MRKIILRPYQEELIQNARTSLAKNKRIIVQSPTGSGKSATMARMVEIAFSRGKKILVVSHRIEIVKQNAKSIRQEGISVGLISPKRKKTPELSVNSAMAQTLLRRCEKKEWEEYIKTIDLLIIDEAHDSSANFVFEKINDGCYVVGFTATPVRYGNQRQLALDYNEIVCGPTVQFLIDHGFLCSCRHFSLDAPKMDDVEFDYGRGDYVLCQMAEKFKSKTRYVGTVDNWERIAKGTKTIVFCCSSEQAIEITKEFCARGYSAKYSLSGNFDDDEKYSDERKQIVQDFAEDKFDILVNVGQMVAGIDVPAIKTCVLCYATMSVTKYLQCLGRASRPHPTKNGEFICLDMGANYERHGMFAQNRKWYLWHDTSKKGGPAPVKECPTEEGGCGRLIPIQTIDCPFCGHHFNNKRELYEIRLQEIISDAAYGKETIEQYVARKKLQGWKNNWILRDICQKNPDHQKEVFLRAIEILMTKHGEKINPDYWWFFKKHVLAPRKR